MESRKLGVVVAVLGVVAVVVLFVVLKGSGDSGSSSTATSTSAQSSTPEGAGGSAAGGGQSSPTDTIVVKDGQPVGGVQEFTFTEGGEINFVVKSDVSDEVHFHGYDIGKDVEAGGQVEFNVPATISGVFEVELENRVVPLAEITVDPS
jgi:hypothetical protein